MPEQVSCSVLCQFLDESDREARWVTHREYEKAGESLAPDTNAPSSSTGTAASLWGHRKEMDSFLSTREKCWVDMQNCLTLRPEHQTLEIPAAS